MIFELVSDVAVQEFKFFVKCRVKNSIQTVSDFPQFHEHIFNSFLLKLSSNYIAILY